MSDYESHFGKLKEIDLNEELSVKQRCELLQDIGYEFHYIEEDFVDSDDIYYHKDSNKFFRLYEHKRLKEDESILIKTEEGFTFSANFYNGGTDINEMIGELLTEEFNERD